MNKYILPILTIFATIFFTNCEEDSAIFTLGEDYVESQTQLNLIDTFSVKLSTVLLDSVVTSNKDNILVGHYEDETFGKISSDSYIQMGIPTSYVADDLEEDTYDSLTLELSFNYNTLGDLEKEISISIHQLTETIELNDDDELCSFDSFDYDPNPIGSITFTPEDEDSLTIKLDDDLGQQIFAKMKEDEDIFGDTDQFVDYFPGLVLVADDSYSESIVGFTASSTKMILHTTRPSLENLSMAFTFSIFESDKQFNNISHDFSGTNLSSLNNQKVALQNSTTDELAFLHGGIGLAIKVEFPSLENLLLLERGIIKNVKLTLTPKVGSYEEFDLPTSLLVYESDEKNRIHEDYGEVSYSDLIVDKIYNETTTYIFDLSSYIELEMEDYYIDPDKGLIITPTNMNYGFPRLLADCSGNKVKLEIYYLSY